MSVYESFSSIAAALDAFAGGKCRRHVEVDGHVVDLVHVANERDRVREEPSMMPPHDPIGAHEAIGGSRATWDLAVAANVAAWLQDGADAVKVARPKPGPLCPCCLRPEALTGGEP